MNKAEIVSIINEFLNGNKEFFSQIIHNFQKQVFDLCVHFLSTPQEAEDATTEIFIKVYKSLNSFNSNYKFSSWIYKIAINHVNDILRKKKREKKYLLSEFFNTMKQTEPKTPDSVFLKKIETKKLKQALRSISINYQTTLMLKYYYEFSYQQISEIMDIPVNTIGSLIFRGKRELREKLKEMEA